MGDAEIDEEEIFTCKSTGKERDRFYHPFSAEHGTIEYVLM